MSQPSTSSDPSLVEVAVPLPLSHAWIAYACRASGLSRPKWSPGERVWTATGRAQSGDLETITMRAGEGPRSVRVTAPADLASARRVVTSLITGMQWSLRQKRAR